MYPIRIRLHGIRDFTPRSMDLGAEKDNVLIGGKNGSGKSTLVYAMAFALVSGRVSIEGLRSKIKRKEQDYWHALAGMLFHNPPGPQQKDAPEYVELVAEVKSQAGSERKVEVYYLRGGETPDKLEVIHKFTSKGLAQDYYKRVFDIDAEGYFMFWYQGAIATFANIPDRERFQKVAEMFQLDEIQRQWQQARTDMKIAEEDFENAKTIALVKRRRLQELEKHKNALEQRDNLRREGLLLLDACWHQLLDIARLEEEKARLRLAELEKECQCLTQSKEDLEIRLRRVQVNLEGQSEHKNAYEEQGIQIRTGMDGLNRELSAWRRERDELSTKVSEVANKMKHIYRSKEELLEEQGRLKESRARLLDEIQALTEQIEGLTEEEKELNRKIGADEKDKKTIDDNLYRMEEQDRVLAAEAELSRDMEEMKKRIDAARELLGQKKNQRQEKQSEYSWLMNRDTLLLTEQEKLIKVYHEAGIQAVAFGELFSIRPGVDTEKAETVLGPLKHTVFVERLLAKTSMEKSFYVAPVGEGVKRPWFDLVSKAGEVFQLVQLEEKVAKGLSEGFLKGIDLWVNQVEITSTDQPPEVTRGKLRLWRGTLWDSHGVRGPVERVPSIGSIAMEKVRAKVRYELDQFVTEITLLEQTIQTEEAQVTGLANNLRLRQEINRALPELRVRLAGLEKELNLAYRRYDEITQEHQQLRLDKQGKVRVQEKGDLLLKGVEGELAVYAEYEKEAEAVARINELDNKILNGERQAQVDQERLIQVNRSIEALGLEIQKLNQEIQEINIRLNGIGIDLESKEKHRQQQKEEADNLSLEGDEYRKYLDEISGRFKEVVEKITSTGQWLPPEFSERERTRANLQRKVKEGQDTLDNALARQVDEEARQKYNDYALEFAEASKELEESQVRFTNLKNREQDKRNEFDKAVYNRWQRTNQKFSGFMQRLNMVGVIQNVVPDPEGRNPQYQWELHVATKLGHKPEKIHPESGRVVGEGISGGERAAVSLVFALALLSDIENRPPFYVLDEFDSALDEERKHEIFDLYREILGRKLVIVSPKVHGDQYLNRFRKFHCVVANPGVLPNQTISEVYDVTREEYQEIRGQDE